MADESSDGLLSQDDINEALAASGLPDAAVEASSSEAEAAPEAAEAGSGEADDRVDSTGRPFDEVAAAMAEAIETESAAAPAPPPVDAKALDIPEVSSLEDGSAAGGQGIDMLRDVELNVRIELGRSQMLVEDVLRLGEGSVVELDKLAGDPVDVLVNNRLVARGEVLVLNDNFCVRINDILSQGFMEEEE